MPRSFTPAEQFPVDSRKQQIVETVLRLVATQEPEAARAEWVGDAVGVTEAAVFGHVPTKEAIWLAVMDWLDQRLVAIYSAAEQDDEPGLVVLSRVFRAHIKLIEEHPALAKLVFADHLRLQYPSLQARFARIHKAYTSRLCAVIDRAKSEAIVSATVPTKDAATMFLSLIQGLGFQFAIARVPVKLVPEAERIFPLYLQAMTPSATAAKHALEFMQR